MSDTTTAERTKPTRTEMVKLLAKCAKKAGHIPESARLGMGTWLMLAEDVPPWDRQPPLPPPEGRPATVVIAGVPFRADLELEEGVVIFESKAHPEAGGRFDGLDYVVF